MTSSQPPGSLQAVWIIGRLFLRRQINTITSFRFRRRRTTPGTGGRVATPMKSSSRSIVGGVVVLFLFLNGLLLGARGVSSISNAARNVAGFGDKMVIHSFTYDELAEAQAALQQLAQDDDLPERKKYMALWNDYVDHALALEARLSPLTEDQERARAIAMRDVFASQGVKGFAVDSTPLLLVSQQTWPPSAAAESGFVNSIGAMFILWIVIISSMSLAATNKDLGQVDWSLEWLYTFPVSSRALFVSRLCSFSFLNQLAWCFLFPFVIEVYLAGGYGVFAVPLGLVVTIYLAILSGAVALLLEVALRKTLSLSRLKNVQAAFSILSTAGLLLFFAFCFTEALSSPFAPRLGSLGTWWVWNPFSVPLVLAMKRSSGARLMSGVLEMVFVACGAVSVALLGSEWLTRDGLVRAGGPYQGARGTAARAGTRGSLLRGITGVELHLLTRDRNLLVQVVFVPLTIVAYYVIVDPRMLSAVLGNFRHAALAVFAIGAYSLATSAIPLLERDSKTLWHLLTFPYSLTSILLRMATFWAVVGLLYGTVILALLVHFGTHLHASSVGDALIALYGIPLYAFIASGIGILATNVFETERRGRIKVSLVYLYLILAAMYANLFYAASVWSKFAQLALSTLLAFALWQKVNDACPYLLDPTESPPRVISLADGLIAALAFFVAQAVGIVVLPYLSSMPFAVQMTLAYTAAGLSVAAVVLFTLWHQGIPTLWQTLAIVPQVAQARPGSMRRTLYQGALWGVAAALGALVYVRALSWFPQWQLWKQSAELHSFLAPGSQPLWIWALLVVAAPVFEEFLFRGLVFQGLQRSTGPILAVIGSAALFALVHPPIAVIPVFGLGIAAAISFNRSKFLLAPIVTHAVYNCAILLLNRA